MKDQIRHLIDTIEAGHAVEAEQMFNDIVLQKAGDALEAMRADVASNMFTDPTGTTEE